MEFHDIYFGAGKSIICIELRSEVESPYSIEEDKTVTQFSRFLVTLVAAALVISAVPQVTTQSSTPAPAQNAGGDGPSGG
jgi:hypothetical protein